MTDDELKKRGEKFFDKLHVDDKTALKRFLTGQIQNILANEHGISTGKGVREAVERKADERVDALLTDERFFVKLAERLAKSRSIDFSKLITDAAKREAEKQIQAAAGYAAKRVRVEVFVDPDPNPPGAAPGYAQF